MIIRKEKGRAEYREDERNTRNKRKFVIAAPEMQTQKNNCRRCMHCSLRNVFCLQQPYTNLTQTLHKILHRLTHHHDNTLCYHGDAHQLHHRPHGNTYIYIDVYICDYTYISIYTIVCLFI